MIFIIISGVFFLTTILFGFLFFRVNHKLRDLTDTLLSKQRIGYYDIIKTGYTSYSARVHVTEIERYTNGKSKIKFLKLENLNVTAYRDRDYDSFVENFKCPELRDTNLIEWLVIEEDIKQQRLKKLKELGL